MISEDGILVVFGAFCAVVVVFRRLTDCSVTENPWKKETHQLEIPVPLFLFFITLVLLAYSTKATPPPPPLTRIGIRKPLLRRENEGENAESPGGPFSRLDVVLRNGEPRNHTTPLSGT